MPGKRKKFIIIIIGLLIAFFGLTIHKFEIKEAKKNFISLVKNQQEKSVSTLAITALPLWLAIKDQLIDKEK